MCSTLICCSRTPTRDDLKEERSFWLTVSEASVHGHLVPSLWVMAKQKWGSSGGTKGSGGRGEGGKKR